MSKDISTMYTKQKNKKAGRKGYGNWKREKEDVISPKKYGQFREEVKCNGCKKA